MTCEIFPTFCKDDVETLDYKIDWDDWLSTGTSEVISTSTWTVPSGITKDSDDKDSTYTTIWLSGGTLGEAYTLTNKIVTSDIRTSSRSIIIVMGDR